MVAGGCHSIATKHTTYAPRPNNSRKATDGPCHRQHTPDRTTSIKPSLKQSSPAEAQTSGEPAHNLNLTRKDISSAAPRSFAEQSPFRGHLPKTVERQIASAAAETGPWTEERLYNDRIRFRRGNTCVTAQRPRAASIDPLNEASGRIPWRMSKPEECTD